MSRPPRWVRLLKWLMTVVCIATGSAIPLSYFYEMDITGRGNTFGSPYVLLDQGVLRICCADRAQSFTWHIPTQVNIRPVDSRSPRTTPFRLPGVQPLLTEFGRIGTTLALPLWLPLALLTPPTLLAWRPRRPTPPGHCPRCRYNLTGNTTGVCPECGLELIKTKTGAPPQTAAPRNS